MRSVSVTKWVIYFFPFLLFFPSIPNQYHNRTRRVTEPQVVTNVTSPMVTVERTCFHLAFTMSDNHALKRQQTDPQEEAQTQPLQKSRFWFDDGNVILQAENTQFRVHRSLLSMHSNIFKDIFSVPQPTDTTTTLNVDGCPVITLSDKADDLEHVLSIFYETIR